MDLKILELLIAILCLIIGVVCIDIAYMFRKLNERIDILESMIEKDER